MLTFMTILMMVLSVLLVLVVLLQPGKGDMVSGMGSLGGTFSNMFGSRRTMDLLSKITWGFAIAILVFSLVTNRFFVGQDSQIVKPAIEGTVVPQTVPTQIPQPIPNMPQEEKKQENTDDNQN